MTAQEYYNLLVRSASDGTFPSVGTYNIHVIDLVQDARCLYQSADGKHKCAAGLLLKTYHREMEGVSCYALQNDLDIPDGLEIEDIRETQVIHDGLAVRETWRPEQFVELLQDLKWVKKLKEAVA